MLYQLPELRPRLGPLQQTAGDLHWDDCTVGNVMLYQLPELRPRLGPLFPQEVSGREMDVTELTYNPRALCPLPSTGSAQDEDNVRFAHHEAPLVEVNQAIL